MARPSVSKTLYLGPGTIADAGGVLARSATSNSSEWCCFLTPFNARWLPNMVYNSPKLFDDKTSPLTLLHADMYTVPIDLVVVGCPLLTLLERKGKMECFIIVIQSESPMNKTVVEGKVKRLLQSVWKCPAPDPDTLKLISLTLTPFTDEVCKSIGIPLRKVCSAPEYQPLRAMLTVGMGQRYLDNRSYYLQLLDQQRNPAAYEFKLLGTIDIDKFNVIRAGLETNRMIPLTDKAQSASALALEDMRELDYMAAKQTASDVSIEENQFTLVTFKDSDSEKLAEYSLAVGTLPDEVSVALEGDSEQQLAFLSGITNESEMLVSFTGDVPEIKYLEGSSQIEIHGAEVPNARKGGDAKDNKIMALLGVTTDQYLLWQACIRKDALSEFNCMFEPYNEFPFAFKERGEQEGLDEFKGRLDSAIASNPSVCKAVYKFVTTSIEARQMNKTLGSCSAKETRDFLGESGRGTKRLADAIHSSNTGRQKKHRLQESQAGQSVNMSSSNPANFFCRQAKSLQHVQANLVTSFIQAYGGKPEKWGQDVCIAKKLCRVYLTLVKEGLAKPILSSKYANTYDTCISKPFQRLTGRDAPTFNFKKELGFNTCQKCWQQVSGGTELICEAFCSLACLGDYYHRRCMNCDCGITTDIMAETTTCGCDEMRFASVVGQWADHLNDFDKVSIAMRVLRFKEAKSTLATS